MNDLVGVAIIVTGILVFLVLPTWIKLSYRDYKARKKRKASIQAGRNEPASINPLIDPALCMGSGACVTACPEDVLGIVGGQAKVIAGSKCIGHGVCAVVCPVQAIQLVFGSEKRGIDIPSVAPDFQTNVPGIYIAGELGGMGLIANAVEQGIQAVDGAAKGVRKGEREFDIVIVGAGPAGIGAALQAQQLGLTYALLEQEEFGGAVRHYPRQKLVMTRRIHFPGYGKVKLFTLAKEDLIELFEAVIAKTGLQVRTGERVASVAPQGAGFQVTTNRGRLETSRVVISIGRRGTPRTLGVPGEEQEKVAYRLVDAELYSHQHILVVGGGDSAIEAAVDLGKQPGNRVTLSYRKKALGRPKPDNVTRLQAAEEAGQVTMLLGSVVTAIEVDRVTLKQDGNDVVVPNDFVFVFAGGVLPTGFLKDAGISIQRHHGRRVVPA